VRDTFAGLVCQRCAIRESHSANWNKRQDVGRAQAWMLASMCPHVDQFCRHRHGFDRSFNYVFWESGEGYHGAVVVGVDVAVEDARGLD
jgi:hypothetical protein